MPDGSSMNAGQPRKLHPGAGRRRGGIFPKGRQVDPASLEEVRRLTSDSKLDRDFLIENLHLIQDQYGSLHARHLAALAELMRLALAEVYEVATFYAHFDVVLDGETPPQEITVRVCDSLTCACLGANELKAELLEKVDSDKVRVIGAPCVGRCFEGPTAWVGKTFVDEATADSIMAKIDQGQIHEPDVPSYRGLDAYRSDGGYSLLESCINGDVKADDIIETLKDSRLRGLGGAGFPTGMKWDFVRREEGPRYMAVNGDEGEPGTFKDRHYLERDPHRFFEGILIGAWVADADIVYIYMRDEYPAVLKILADELEALEAAGLTGGREIQIRRGAGAYICGEESAMLESIEGKRGVPRHKPPYPTQVGLFGRPTLINNVETLYWVRDIVEKGADWFTSHGANGRQGLRTYSVSGRVKEPGVKLAPAGTTVTQLIEEYCGGMEEGHSFKAYLPGGASGGILPASLGDVPLDFDTLQEHGCFIGSAAVMVLSDQDNMKDVVKNLMHFFWDESCGQCTPCRNGTEKALKIMGEDKWDLDLLDDLAAVMMDSSICGLGQAAPNPLVTTMKHFRDELA